MSHSVQCIRNWIYRCQVSEAIKFYIVVCGSVIMIPYGDRPCGDRIRPKRYTCSTFFGSKPKTKKQSDNNSDFYSGGYWFGTCPDHHLRSRFSYLKPHNYLSSNSTIIKLTYKVISVTEHSTNERIKQHFAIDHSTLTLFRNWQLWGIINLCTHELLDRQWRNNHARMGGWTHVAVTMLVLRCQANAN